MNERLRGTVWFVALQLVFMAALAHLALGLWNWARWVDAGFLLPRDFRWPVFVASALAIYYGIHRALYADDRRPYYLAGIVVMLGYAVGYFLWHLIGHPAGLDPSTWFANETISLQWFLDHLFAGAVEFFAIAVEVSAAVLLAVLYITAPDGEREQGDVAAEEAGEESGDASEQASA